MPTDVLKMCYIIGDPVAHSLSPAMHNAAYKALGIDYVFNAQRLALAELEAFMADVRIKGIHALAVTVPHKEAVIKYLDELDETAKQIGAVNTVVNKNGRLFGYNTDCYGAIESLKKHTVLVGKKVALLGSGGSARAVVYGLVKEKCEVVIYGRNTDKANGLAKTFGCKALPWDERNSLSADIIINTTPIGREGDELPLDEKVITEKHIVFDINYAQNSTPLLRAAAKKHATTVDGLEMLLRQGMLQFELYTGLKAPEEAMNKALHNKVSYEDAV